MDTEALLINGRTFVPARYVAEAFGATVRWKDEIKTVYIDANKTDKVEDEDDTREVAGLLYQGYGFNGCRFKDDTSYEVVFTIGFLKKDVEKQKDDMEKILLQKFSEETVKEIMSVVRSKVKDTDVIEARYFYDKKADQYMYMPKSWRSEVQQLPYIYTEKETNLFKTSEQILRRKLDDRKRQSEKLY